MTVCSVCEQPIVKTFESTTGEVIWDHVETNYPVQSKLPCWCKAQPMRQPVLSDGVKAIIADYAPLLGDVVKGRYLEEMVGKIVALLAKEAK